jgi:hypothetical protein
VVQVELAEKTAVLFTKDGDQHNNLFDMQCMWLVVLFTLCLSGTKAIWVPLKYVCYSACMFTLVVCHFFCRLEQEITDKEFYEDTRK